MDRLRRMEMFVRAAKAGSFARAAQLLQIDPSTVSHAIAKLEKELRLTLFYRTTRQLSLTESGAEIFQCAREVLSQIADLDSIAAAPHQALSGTLRLGMAVPTSRSVIEAFDPEQVTLTRNPAFNAKKGAR